MTKSEKFTLSKGSGNLLRSMKQELFVDAYVTKGLPKLDAFVRDLRDLVQEYKNAGTGKLDYVIIQAKDEDTKKKAKDAGLIDTRAVIYFLSVAIVCLLVSFRALESRKWS